MSNLHKQDIDNNNGVIVETTEFYPSHFMVRIESFSLLSGNIARKYESTVFKAGGYKWRLVLYPNGIEDNSDDVSVHLSMADPKSMDLNWEVNAIFSIFLYNQISHNFLCMREMTRRRFHALAPCSGFSKFVSKKVLNDPSNGYLVDDVCIFGADVFVFDRPNNIERLSFTKVAKPYSCFWTITKFSKLKEAWCSGSFTVGKQNWKVYLYPQGNKDGKGRCISISLHLSGQEIQKVRAEFTFTIKDQSHGNNKHNTQTDTDWFCEKNGWGMTEFMTIADMKNPKKGYLVKDCCILQVEITVLAVAILE